MQFVVRNTNTREESTFDYFDEILIDKEIIDAGDRCICEFSDRGVMDSVKYIFTLGFADSLISNYTGDKKYAVSFTGYGTNGWYDGDNIGELLIRLKNYYCDEGIIEKNAFKYSIQARESGDFIESAYTLYDAVKRIEEFYEVDKSDAVFEENFYEIKRIDCYTTRIYDDAGTLIHNFNEKHDILDLIDFYIPSQKDLAKYLGVTPGAVSQYDNTKKELMLLGLWAKKEFGLKVELKKKYL